MSKRGNVHSLHVFVWAVNLVSDSPPSGTKAWFCCWTKIQICRVKVLWIYVFLGNQSGRPAILRITGGQIKG